MDKRKVMVAYQRGFLTLHECAQILGVEGKQVHTLLKNASDTDRLSVHYEATVNDGSLRISNT
ncbi:putative DNA-binding ArsR family transcriptional regulator [Paenibacillus shirakamiensis]|uniref:DNA-binding ArsR family transcriptional regulator n=1 Tax=Paenibacillus shirakamiensis TaxID=1265935 RepID=A0ABS4JCT8_9BACL|nr:hypothetical protein [Paenibacillus shirakamiensis]MBP1999542.1 putative DNA-binding ArsR family transcriptional regulator [Paenibacillus shirakamiensis]